MMEDYTTELEERLPKKKHTNGKLVPDETALNMQPVNKPSTSGLADFTDCRMAVMMLCVDSATTESGSDCSLVEMVRKLAISVVGEVIVTEESWNSIIVAVRSTVVTQLLAFTGQIISQVRASFNIGNPSYSLSFSLLKFFFDILHYDERELAMSKCLI